MNTFAVVFLVIVLAAAGAGAAFWVSYFQPALEEESRLNDEVKNLEGKLNQIKTVADDIARLNDEIAKLTQEISRLQMESNQLNTIVPKLLDSIEAISNKFNVKFQDIRINPLVRGDDWSELPVEISLVGTFNDIGNFLVICEKRKILNLAIGSINITVSAETDPKTKSPLLSVTLNAKAFIMGSGY